MGELAGQRAIPAVQPVVGAGGVLRRQREAAGRVVGGMPRWRAERWKSLNMYVALAVAIHRAARPVAWKMTPSSTGCQRTLRPWAAATASIFSLIR